MRPGCSSRSRRSPPGDTAPTLGGRRAARCGEALAAAKRRTPRRPPAGYVFGSMRTDGKPRGSDGAPQRFYRPELDGLRFFAFLAVFVHHWLWYGPEWYEGIGLPRAVGELLAATAKSGAYGVDLFFVLSAYLITELLIRERIERGTLDAARFYAR